MKDKYTPGQDCGCYAYSESECGCGADWTPSEVYELRGKLERERDLADRLADALRVAYGLITRHHEVGVTQELGCFCPVCHRDGKEPEMDQIIAALTAWKEARSE